LTPNELVLTFGGLHVCVQFCENRLRNATVRVSTDGQTHTHTHTHTHGQTQNDFIICPMLYAIAMGQIITNLEESLWIYLASTLVVQAGFSFGNTLHIFTRRQNRPLKSMGNRCLSRPALIRGRILTIYIALHVFCARKCDLGGRVDATVHIGVKYPKTHILGREYAFQA